MKIESSKFNLFGKNKDSLQRELKQAVGRNIWVKVELFKNSPLISMMNIGNMFGMQGTCWARLLAVVDNFYICNICKASENDQGTIEVTKEEIKKILTTKCKVSTSTLTLITPVEMLTTDELFTVVAEHLYIDNHNDDHEDGFIDDDDEDDYDEDDYDED